MSGFDRMSVGVSRSDQYDVAAALPIGNQRVQFEAVPVGKLRTERIEVRRESDSAGFIQFRPVVKSFFREGRATVLAGRHSECGNRNGDELTVGVTGQKRIEKNTFVPAFRLVQSLLAAKRDLRLDRELRRLDAFDAIIIDDIGYIQQNRDEMEVLFTLLAERYERRTVMISSNLVFSQWDRIFKDPMTTAAAIDRVVHHATILELTGDSYRTDSAKKRNRHSSVKKKSS